MHNILYFYFCFLTFCRPPASAIISQWTAELRASGYQNPNGLPLACDPATYDRYGYPGWVDPIGTAYAPCTDTQVATQVLTGRRDGDDDTGEYEHHGDLNDASYFDAFDDGHGGFGGFGYGCGY